MPAPLFDPARHEPLAGLRWRAGGARDGITAICDSVAGALRGERLWPLHPGDDDPGTAPDGILRGLYIGAAGVLHALARLTAAGLWEPGIDLPAVAGGLCDGITASPDEEGAGASLLVGSSGVLLVAHRHARSAGEARSLADAIADVIAANAAHPSNELLLGAPGTMLAARAMYERTGEDRFAALWRTSARTLLERQDADGLWTQDLYGNRLRYLGAGHGFAGNIRALFGASEWLEGAAAVEARAVLTARSLAIRDGDRASWAPLRGGSRTGAPPRVQWCHGAAGIVTSLAPIGIEDAEHGALLEAAGELVWQAGPLARNAGLCHGTAGNGFAFLALWARSGDERWLERARAFAMHALAQVARWRAAAGRGRYTLFTGDLGAALLTAGCLTGDTGFPGIDDL